MPEERPDLVEPIKLMDYLAARNVNHDERLELDIDSMAVPQRFFRDNLIDFAEAVKKRRALVVQPHTPESKAK